MAKTKVHGEYLRDSVVRFTAKAGENITKGQPVYISGISGELPVVSLADADNTAKMPAFGLAEATVLTNDEVEITSFGTLAGLDTSTPGYSLGDILYVDTTAGALTNNPSGLEATKLQNIGIVQRVHASNGSIKVGGAGRTNAVPNLDNGDIFIGDSNNKAISSSLATEIESYLDGGTSTPTFSTATVTGDLTVDTNTLYVDSTNNRVGVGTTSPSQQLETTGNIFINAASGNPDLTIKTAGAGNNPSVNYRAGNSIVFDNMLVASAVTDYWRVGYGASGTVTNEYLAVTSAGNVGIGTTSPSNTLTLSSGTNDGRQLKLYGTSNNALIKFDNADTAQEYSMGLNASAFIVYDDTNSAYRLTLDSSGNVGIGTTSPNSTLEATKAITFSNVDTFGQFVIKSSSGSTGDLLNFGVDSANSLAFIQAVERGVFYIPLVLQRYGGNVGIGTNSPTDKLHVVGTTFLNGNTYIGSGGAGNIYLSAGTGIYMDGGTGAANHLDDYEEGTWTPSITFGGTSASVTLDGQNYYVKIGSLVWCNLKIKVTSTNSGVGTLNLNGLPYASANTYYHGHVQWDDNWTLPSGAGSAMPYTGSTINGVRILYQTYDGHADMTSSHFSATNANLYGFIIYRVA